jgi:hypothetical protein
MNKNAGNGRDGSSTYDVPDATRGLETLMEEAFARHSALYEQHPIAITVLMTDFLMPYLRELYGAFEGDLVKAIVLGEIGQANMRRFVASQHRDAIPLELVDHGIRDSLVRGCNGLSVSMASGIAKETVRRKIKELEAEGLIAHHPEGGWQATPEAATRFSPTFNRDLSKRLLQTALRIANLGANAAPIGQGAHSGVTPPPQRGDDANASAD